MTRIKCCGMTRIDDALLAAQLGADAIGVVLTARSKRRVTIEQAQAIVRALPPFVTSVTLFMDDDAAFVREAIEAIQPDLVQFHGAESDDWCAQFGRRYLKAIAMGEGAAALPSLHRYPGAAGLLLDGHGLREAGGSGKAFDWSLMPRELSQPLLLAGADIVPVPDIRRDDANRRVRRARSFFECAKTLHHGRQGRSADRTDLLRFGDGGGENAGEV